MTDDPSALPPIDRIVVSHAQLIARLRRDMDELASEFTDTTAGFIGRLDDLEATATSGSSPRAWCWRNLGPHATRELQDQLTDWVEWVRARYPLAKRIPPCWSMHPEVVEELTGLWLAWQHAYEDRHAPLTGPIEWHDRWLPGVIHRLEHGAFALDCTARHQDRSASSYASSDAPASG